MQIGEQLWVYTSDPLAVIDIPHFCQEFGHPLMETQEVNGGHRFLISKGVLDSA